MNLSKKKRLQRKQPKKHLRRLKLNLQKNLQLKTLKNHLLRKKRLKKPQMNLKVPKNQVKNLHLKMNLPVTTNLPSPKLKRKLRLRNLRLNPMMMRQ